MLSMDGAARAPRDPLLETPATLASDLLPGEVVFNLDWRSPPALRRALGPDFAATRCAACHVEAAGAGAQPAFAPNGRIAPSLFGWGLLEAIPAATLQSMADPLDRNGDGISGRLPVGRDAVTGAHRTGRFGWQASEPSLHQQVAKALLDDMGITTDVYPGADGADGAAAGPDSSVELPAHHLRHLVRYVAHLAAPNRRHLDRADVRRGELVFIQSGCASCHVPAIMTGPHPEPALSEQLVWPYSDLLLHDMGPGLADAGGGLDAREWRTPPLWGLGLMLERYPQRGLLHDGRARTLMDAIRWHGGEALPSRERVLALPPRDRDALLAFLRSL
jgi:CxxC motif-containing protein (DUF1111 family)